MHSVEMKRKFAELRDANTLSLKDIAAKVGLAHGTASAWATKHKKGTLLPPSKNKPKPAAQVESPMIEDLMILVDSLRLERRVLLRTLKEHGVKMPKGSLVNLSGYSDIWRAMNETMWNG